MTRQQANGELADILTYLIELNPDLRFSQILLAYEFVMEYENEFYKEPQVILERVRKALEQSNIT